jgi:hypothetical protein
MNMLVSCMQICGFEMSDVSMLVNSASMGTLSRPTAQGVMRPSSGGQARAFRLPPNQSLGPPKPISPEILLEPMPHPHSSSSSASAAIGHSAPSSLPAEVLSLTELDRPSTAPSLPYPMYMTRQAVGRPDQSSSVAGIIGQLKLALAKNLHRIIDTFREFDEDQSGRINKREFRLALQKLGIVAHKSTCDLAFDSLDNDRSGTLEYEELNTHLRRRAGDPSHIGAVLGTVSPGRNLETASLPAPATGRSSSASERWTEQTGPVGAGSFSAYDENQRLRRELSNMKKRCRDLEVELSRPTKSRAQAMKGRRT